MSDLYQLATEQWAAYRALLERIAQAAQEGAAGAEWSGELLAQLLDEVRALSLLVQAPSRRDEALPEAEPTRADQLPQDAPERLLEVDQWYQRADQLPSFYQARLGRLSDEELAAEVLAARARHLQADREQRTRQQMREAGIQQTSTKSST